jgi:two-component sensor histidine kinase
MPVVEPSPQGDVAELTQRPLEQRLRQQEILAEFGVAALQGTSLDQLLGEAARLAAEGLRAEFSKVLELLPSQDRLLVRAGVGWEPGIVGAATVGADLDSPAGFALRTGKPVISNHLENEQRFRTPEILHRHSIKRAMNVILQGDEKPFGVLEVDSHSESMFEEHDLTFLKGVANILGMAIERERHERSLSAAVERQQFLMKEMNHRVKNSLAIVASMLHLQASDVGDATLRSHLEEAGHRVAAVSKVYDQLHVGSDLERLDVGRYIEGLCEDLDASMSQCEVRADVEYGIDIATDRAVSVALMVNELVANAAKYAYAGDSAGGTVRVAIARTGAGGFSLAVRDEGIGLPATFDFAKEKGLGMRIIRAFVQQLNGTMAVHPRDPGTEFVINIPQQDI